MSNKRDYNNLNEEKFDELKDGTQATKKRQKFFKSLTFKIAIAVAVVMVIVTGSVFYSSAIFTANTNESIAVSFSTLNFETEISTSGVARTQSQNVKYVVNYYNDEPMTMLENARVRIAANSLPGYLRVQAQYGYDSVSDSALTTNLKIIISHLNAGVVNPYNISGTYRWSYNNADGYYYLMDMSGRPLIIQSENAYQFIQQSNPIKYNAVAPLSLELTAGEEQILRSLALLLNFECVQALAQYSTIEELKLNSPEFASGISQASSFGNVLAFDTNGGDNYSAVLINSNTTSLSSFVPNKEGYNFANWEQNNAVVNSVNFSSNKTQSIKAKWVAKTYNINYRDKGDNDFSGTTITNPTTYIYGQETPLPQVVNRAGHTFLGWFSDMACTKAVSTISANSTGDITVYAKWSPNELRIIYENMQNAVFLTEATSTFSYGSNTNITVPDAYKNGYGFAGWYLSADGSGERVAFINTADYADNITLYARFYELPYNISFVANQGTVVGGGNVNTLPNVTYSATTAFTLPNVDSVTRQGFSLVGWQVASTSTDSNWQINAVYMPGETYLQTPYKYRYGDVQLQALWEIELNATTLELVYTGLNNSGEEISQSKTYDVSVGETVIVGGQDLNTCATSTVSSLNDITPKKYNSIFVGWALTASSATPEYTDSYLVQSKDINASTHKITLYAVYKSVAYYAITNNASGSSYSVYATTSSGDAVFLFDTNSYELCFTGACKHSKQTQVTFHFGNSISAGKVSGALNTGNAMFDLSKVASPTSILNFANGQIKSTKDQLTSMIDNSNAKSSVLYYVGAGKTLNLGSSEEGLSLSVESKCYMFFSAGVVNVYNGYYQMGTETSKISNANNVMFAASENSSALTIHGGTFIYHSSATSTNCGMVYVTKGSATINGGYFETSSNGCILVQIDSASFVINGGEFYLNSSNDASARTANARMFSNYGGSLTINDGSFISNSQLFYSQNLDNSCTTTINGGNFVSCQYMFYMKNSAEESLTLNNVLTITGGKFLASSISTKPVLTFCGGIVSIYGGEFTSEGTAPVIQFENNASTKKLTIGSTTKVLAKQSHAIYVCGTNDSLDIFGSAEIYSDGGSAIRKESTGYLYIKDYAIIQNNTLTSSYATIYANRGQINLTGSCQVINAHMSTKENDAIFITESAKLRIYKDSAVSNFYGTTNFNTKFINILTKSANTSSQAIEIKSIDGTNPCFVVDNGSGSKFLKVTSNAGAAVIFDGGVYATISDGLFTSESSSVLYFREGEGNFVINGNTEIAKYKTSIDSNISNAVVANPGVNGDVSAILFDSNSSATLTIEGNAIIRAYDANAINTGAGEANPVINIGSTEQGNPQIISDNDVAIMFSQTGINAKLNLYNDPIIYAINNSKAHIAFARAGVISAKKADGSASLTSLKATTSSSENQLMRLNYIGTSNLVSGDIVLENLDLSLADDFVMTNAETFLVYKSAQNALLIGKQNFVYYDANGGSNAPVDNLEHQRGDEIEVKFNPIPYRDGYAFIGWSTIKFTMTPMYEKDITTTFTMPEDSVTLYAVWKLQYVKMWYSNGSNSSEPTFHYSIDDAFTTLNRDTSSDYNTVTIELLKSRISIAQTYMFADSTNVTDAYGMAFSGYRQIAHATIKNINITASLGSNTTPNYVLSLYGANNAFIIGEGYTLKLTNLIVDGGAQSQARESSGRLAYLTDSNSNLIIGANTIVQNFNVTSTDSTFDATNRENDSLGVGFTHGAYGGVVFMLNGTFSLTDNARIQNCSVSYMPSSPLVNPTTSNAKIGVLAGGALVRAHAGYVNIEKGAVIDSCIAEFIGSYDSGTTTAWLDMYGAIDMSNGAVVMHGKIFNCYVLAKNSHTRSTVTQDQFDRINICGVAISLFGTAETARTTLTMGASSGAIFYPEIANCYSSVNTYYGNVLGVAIHTYGYASLTLHNCKFHDLDGTGNNWLLGESCGGAIYNDLLNDDDAESKLSNDCCDISMVGSEVYAVHTMYASALWLRGKATLEQVTITTEYGQAIRYCNDDGSINHNNGLTLNACNVTTLSKIANQNGSCLFIPNENKGIIKISGGSYNAGLGACLWLGVSSSAEPFNTIITNAQMENSGINGAICSYVSGLLKITGNSLDSVSYSKITSTGGPAVVLAGGASENYFNGTGASASVKTVFELVNGRIISTANNSCALYLNNTGLAVISDGEVQCGADNINAAIVINGGFNHVDYKALNRLIIQGGKVESLNEGNAETISALHILNNAYGRVEIKADAVVQTKTHGIAPVIWADGAPFTASDDTNRKNFSTANTLVTISGGQVAQLNGGNVLKNGGTPFYITGGIVTTNLPTQGCCITLDSLNSYCYITGGTFTGDIGISFSNQKDITKQYAYISNGSFSHNSKLISVPAIESGSEPTSSMRYVYITNGTFGGGSGVATTDGYISLNRPTTLSINGGVFGSNNTDVVYVESKVIKSREIIYLNSNCSIAIGGGIFNAKEIFLYSPNGKSDVIIDGNNTKILNFNKQNPGTALGNTTDKLNATFMLTAGAITLTVKEQAQITAVTSSLFYLGSSACQVNVCGSSQTKVQDVGYYWFYSGLVTESTQPLLCLGDTPKIVSINNSRWVVVNSEKAISAKVGTDNAHVFAKFTSDEPNNFYMRICKLNAQPGQVIVVNVNTVNSITNQDRFILAYSSDSSDNMLGYYLDYNENKLILDSQKVEFIYNRNFMMKKGEANVGDFGEMGAVYTVDYPVETGAYVEGKPEACEVLTPNQKLMENAFGRVGYTFDGWSLSIGTGGARTFENGEGLTFIGTDATSTIRINDNSFTAGETLNYDAYGTSVNADVRAYWISNALNAKVYQIRLYAKWKQETYKVTLDISDYESTDYSVSLTGANTTTHTLVLGSNYTYGSTINLANYVPTRTGYKFDGWVETQTVEIGTKKYDFVRIFYQNPYDTNVGTNQVGEFIGTSIDNYKSSLYSNGVYLYSNLIATDNYRRCIASEDGLEIPNGYTYCLSYDNTDFSLVWSQDTNFNKTSNNPSSLQTYYPSTGLYGSNWAGLRLSTNTDGKTYVDGNNGTDNYFAIGTTGAYNSGIKSTDASKFYGGNWETNLNITSFPVSLWQQIGTGNLATVSSYTDYGYNVASKGTFYVRGTTTLKPLWKEIIYTVTLDVNSNGNNDDYIVVETNSLSDVNMFLSNPQNYSVLRTPGDESSRIYGNQVTSATLYIHRNSIAGMPLANSNQADGKLVKVGSLVTLNIQSGDVNRIVTWTIDTLSNFMVIDNITVHIERLKIRQNRTNANTGRFAKVNSNGVLDLNVDLDIFNFKSTEKGSVVYCEGALGLNGASIYDNFSTTDGGAIYISSSKSSSMSGSANYYNNISSQNGGFLYAEGSVALTITGGNYYNSTDTDNAQNGGVIYWNSTGQLQINNGMFYGNTVSNNGGVIYLNNGTMKIYNGTFGGDPNYSADFNRQKANKAQNFGGVIYQCAGTVTISGGTIGKVDYAAEINYYSNYALKGAGIAVIGAGVKLTVAGATIAGNYAQFCGGGIYSYSATVVLNSGCSIYGNYVYRNTGDTQGNYGGGGVCQDGASYSDPANLTINGATIGNDAKPNYAECRGGGLWINRGICTLISGTIGSTANDKGIATSISYANYSNNCGGGVDAYSGKFTMQGGTIGRNYAKNNGGGIRSNSVVQITGGTIKNNYAGSTGANEGGGGIAMRENGSLTISGGEFDSNQAVMNGGAIHLWEDFTGTLNITGGTYKNNIATYGGAINIAKGTVTISGVVIGDGTKTTYARSNQGNHSNSASYGGGISLISGSLTLTNVTIAFNYASFNGGGVYSVGGTLTYDSSAKTIIKCNSAGANDYGGGGVYTKLATNLSNIQITKNGAGISTGDGVATSSYGGGIYIDAPTLTHSFTNDVSITYNYAGNGAGIMLKGTLTLNGSSVELSNNTATQNGGGAYVDNSTLNLTNCEINNNSAINGGGISAVGSATIIMNGTTPNVCSNSATNGGAVYLDPTGTTQPLFDMYNGNIQSNSAQNGGGIYFGHNSTSGVVRAKVNLRSGVVIGDATATSIATTSSYSNKATVQGGAIWCNGGELVLNGNVSICYNYSAGVGGGIYLCNTNSNATEPVLTLSGTNHIKYNLANVGGGVGVETKSTFIINTRLKIHHNKAIQKGGGVHALSQITFDACDIYNNTAVEGGGAYVSGTVTIQNNSKFYSNSVSTTKGNGGGVYLTGKGTNTINGVQIYSNTAQNNGGGLVYNGSGTLNITSANIGQLNMSESGWSNRAKNGAGVWVSAGTVNFNASSIGAVVIRRNYATSGGGIYQNGGTITLTSCQIYGNQADTSGGGVYLSGSGEFNCGVLDATYTENKVLIGHKTYPNVATSTTGGGGVFMNGGTFNLNMGDIGCKTTVLPTSTSGQYANTAPYGAGIMASGGELNIKGGFVRYNYSANAGGVCVGSNCELKMSKGTISYNTNRGLVFKDSTKGSTISGGEISNNSCASTDVGTGGAGILLCSNYTGTLTMTGGTIKNNNSTTNGGGVCLDNGKFTMSNGTISSNTASELGGGVSVNSGTFTHSGGCIGNSSATSVATTSSYSNKAKGGGGVHIGTSGTYVINNANATVLYNYATDFNTSAFTYGGGGVYCQGTLTMSNGLIKFNLATCGGGVHIQAKASSISNGTIANNKASSNGGGAYVGTSATLNMTGGYIGNANPTNVATATAYSNSATNGGGIYCTGTLNIKGSAVVSYNSATSGLGGGVYCQGSLTIEGSANIKNNFATSGAGVYMLGLNGSAKTGSMKGGNIIKNNATTNGGGIFVGNYSTLNFSSGCVGDSSATAVATSSSYSNSATNGGGIYCDSQGILSLSGSALIYYNMASANGGGVYSQGTYNMTSASASIKYNYAGESGGLHLTGGTVSFSGGNISNNTATGKGGGIGAYSNITTTITNVTISNNNAPYGAGLYEKTCNISLAGSTTFTNNTASAYGGGVYIDGSSATTTLQINSGTSVKISSNSANNCGGGVALNGSYAVFKMLAGSIGESGKSNKAVNGGGGLYVANGTVNIKGSSTVIQYNSSSSTTTGNGGGNIRQDAGTITFGEGSSTSDKGTIQYGTSGFAQSGDVLVKGGTFTMNNSNSVIQNNNSSYSCVYISSGTFKITGGKVTANTSSTSVGVVNVAGGTFDISSSLSSVINTGSGNGVAVSGSGVAKIQSKSTITTNGSAAYPIYITSSSARVYLGGSLTLNTSSYYHIYTNSQYTIVGNIDGSASTAFTSNTGLYHGEAGSSYGNRCFINYAYSSPAVNQIVVTGVINGTSANAFGVVATGTNGTTLMPAYGGTSAKTIYLVSTGYTSSGGVDNSPMHYLGYLSGSLNESLVSPRFNRHPNSITSVSIAKRAFVWMYANADFATVLNQYNNNLGTGSKAYIASRYYSSGYSVSNQTFSGSTTTIEWFELNAGANNHKAIYNATGGSTMFTINSGYTVNMYDIQINGNSRSTKGLSNAGTLTMSNVTINNCYSTGLYNTRTASASSLTVSSCQGSSGAGIYNTGSLTLSSSSVYSCSASSNGGGIYSTGSLSLSSCSISSNSSSGSGGGIYISSSNSTSISSCTIGDTSSSVATSYSYSNYASSNGGGIYKAGSGSLSISSTTIGRNYASSNGGGISISGGSTTISGTTPIQYNASTNGGGIYMNSGLTLNYSSIKIQKNSASNGGGVYISNATLTMSAGTIGGSSYGNSASNGGGIYITSTSSATANISGGAVTYNSASYGGGIYSDKAIVKLSGGMDLNYNKASYDGGGLYATSSSNATIEGSSTYVKNNTATNGDGGGVYISTNTSLKYSGGQISNNTASNGGAVYFGGSSFTMDNNYCKIENNKSTSSEYGGGGVYLSKGTFTFSNGYIGNKTRTASSSDCSNYAKTNGGGVYVAGGTFKLSGGNINGNYSSGGGGVYVAGGTFTHSSGYIQYCGATNGGGVYVSGGSFTLSGGYIGNKTSTATSSSDCSNYASSNGGGVYASGGSFSISNGYINGNYASTNGGGVYSSTSFAQSNGYIQYNRATNGGGVYINNTTFNFSGGYIGNKTSTATSSSCSNYASSNGGGIFVYGSSTYNSSTLNMSSTASVNGNYAGTNGGGVYIPSSSSSFTMSGSSLHVDYNYAGTNGGGIYSYIIGLSVNGYIQNNKAGSQGGGIWAYWDTTLTSNARINNNNASYGGGIYASAITLTIDGAILNKNTATYGGGIYASSGTLKANSGEISNSSGNAIETSNTTCSFYCNKSSCFKISNCTGSGDDKFTWYLGYDYNNPSARGSYKIKIINYIWFEGGNDNYRLRHVYGYNFKSDGNSKKVEYEMYGDLYTTKIKSKFYATGVIRYFLKNCHVEHTRYYSANSDLNTDIKGETTATASYEKESPLTKEKRDAGPCYVKATLGYLYIPSTTYGKKAEIIYPKTTSGVNLKNINSSIDLYEKWVWDGPVWGHNETWREGVWDGETVFDEKYTGSYAGN